MRSSTKSAVAGRPGRRSRRSPGAGHLSFHDASSSSAATRAYRPHRVAVGSPAPRLRRRPPPADSPATSPATTPRCSHSTSAATPPSPSCSSTRPSARTVFSTLALFDRAHGRHPGRCAGPRRADGRRQRWGGVLLCSRPPGLNRHAYAVGHYRQITWTRASRSSMPPSAARRGARCGRRRARARSARRLPDHVGVRDHAGRHAVAAASTSAAHGGPCSRRTGSGCASCRNNCADVEHPRERPASRPGAARQRPRPHADQRRAGPAPPGSGSKAVPTQSTASSSRCSPGGRGQPARSWPKPPPRSAPSSSSTTCQVHFVDTLDDELGDAVAAVEGGGRPPGRCEQDHS